MSDDDTENNDVEESSGDAEEETEAAPTEAPPESSTESESSSGDFLEDIFGITKAGSTVEAEIRAGVTTFLTMAYILIVNPKMMSGSDITFMEFDTGIPFNDALFATAVAACVSCNSKKGNRTPKEANMKLMKQARKPNRFIYFKQFVKEKNIDWENYIFSRKN